MELGWATWAETKDGQKGCWAGDYVLISVTAPDEPADDLKTIVNKVNSRKPRQTDMESHEGGLCPAVDVKAD